MNWTGIIYLAIGVNILIAIKLAWDTYNRKKLKRVINHGLSALIDTILYSSIIVFLFNGVEIRILIGLIVLALGYRWITFDALFAKINYGVWRYYGQSSKIDRFLKKMGVWDIPIKLLPIIISLILILI